MDAGVAGLVGALGGAALGAGGAWGAAIIALKGARYQADTQAKSAHDQWLREMRRESYTRFAEAARAAKYLEMIMWEAGGDLSRVQQLAGDMGERQRNLTTAAADVELIAPKEAAKLARQISLSLHARFLARDGALADDPDRMRSFTPIHIDLETKIANFVALSQRALQGTPSGGSASDPEG
ncbi:hypothetical protein AB0M23_12655 [Streptomyces sp. NPDC052077]|uniref:hypothetical protein n=1 Tax=Streptomyces sp. NPDC052077 TaxID=3154757 RepID=UPI00342542E8